MFVTFAYVLQLIQSLPVFLASTPTQGQKKKKLLLKSLGNSSCMCADTQGFVGEFGLVKGMMEDRPGRQSSPAIVSFPANIVLLLACSLATETCAGNIGVFCKPFCM